MELNLGSIITNPKIRKVIYGVYVVAGLILGGIQAWYGVIGENPVWLAQYLAVYGYLGIPVGGLAIANANTTQVQAFELPAPDADLD